MTKLIFLILVGMVTFFGVLLGISEDMAKKRCLDFIEGINPVDGLRIYKAILKYRRGFPVAWLTALIYSESCFDPKTHEADNDKGLGQLTPIACKEIERVFEIKVDESRLFEIEYNIYLTGLFAERSKEVARPYAVDKYNILYATILAYKDWLTWTDWTHVKAERAWKKYQELKHNYLTYKYENKEV